MNQMRGIDSVRDALQLESYPMDRSGVYYAVGDLVVFDAKGAEIPVRDTLERSPRSLFWSADEIVEEIERGAQRRPGKLQSLRSVRPDRALGWLSIALGVGQLLAPDRVAHAAGLGNGRRVIQAYGVREILIGLGLLTQGRKAPWLWARTAGDVLDLATIAAGSGPIQRKSVAAAVVGMVGAVDLVAALRAH